MQIILSRLFSKGTWAFLGAVFCCTLILSAVFLTHTAEANQTVPYKVNFQGRLTNSNGNVMADGSYNIRFRLHSQASGGSALWTETREGTNRVVVKNGLFSLQLGDVTALSPSLFTTYPLFLEVELPTPATATCSTAGCASWTEGAMTPRNPIGAAPQAMNADRLDGLDSTAFAQVGANNTFTGTNTLKNTSTAAFDIQNAGGTSLLVADTTNMKVTVGSSTNNVELSLNGIKLAGNARSTRTVTLSPEYAGATFLGDGTNNNGSLSSDFCSNTTNLAVNTTACAGTGSVNSYYRWTTAEATTQDYDIYVRYRLPSDYDTGSMTNLQFKAQSSVTGQPVSLRMYNNAGDQCSATTNLFTDASVPQWATNTIASPLGASCTTVAADGFVTFRVTVSATNNGVVRAGDISFTYRGKF